jgi:signal transduction histidine kinase
LDAQVSRTDEQKPVPARRVRAGLSLKLLILTILFVLLAEILIFVPSVANYRKNWLEDRLAAAQVAVLVLEAAPREGLPAGLEAQLLEGVGAQAIAARAGGARRLLALDTVPPDVGRTVDLRDPGWPTLIRDAFDVLFNGAEPAIRVIGRSKGEADFVEMIISEEPLRRSMLGFARNILWLSLFIAGMTAALVYLALHLIIVRPVKRLASNVMAFEQDPDNPTLIARPTGRRDEIGEAEEALSRMERTLAGSLRERRRLAAVGLAVSKINHDLRNMLASAQLLSDRIAESRDPSVQRFGPKLIATLNRAIAFCESTLSYGRVTEPVPDKRPVDMRALTQEVADLLTLGEPGRPAFVNATPPALSVTCDPDQMFRVLSNLMRNADQALKQHGTKDGAPPTITVTAAIEGSTGVIRVADNGPGVPERARAALFEAFKGSVSAGGTGLGLAIAAELVKLHGGEIALEDSAVGAVFRIRLPLTSPAAG